MSVCVQVRLCALVAASIATKMAYEMLIEICVKTSKFNLKYRIRFHLKFISNTPSTWCVMKFSLQWLESYFLFNTSYISNTFLLGESLNSKPLHSVADRKSESMCLFFSLIQVNIKLIHGIYGILQFLQYDYDTEFLSALAQTGTAKRWIMAMAHQMTRLKYLKVLRNYTSKSNQLEQKLFVAINFGICFFQTMHRRFWFRCLAKTYARDHHHRHIRMRFNFLFVASLPITYH